MNNNIKNAIKNNVVSTDSFFKQSSEKVAKVVKSNEKNGTCTIQYKTFDGLNVVKPDVKVRLSTTSVIDWFPKKDDFVFIREDMNTVMIIADANHMVKSNIKTATNFEKDIYSNAVSDFLGGFII